MSDRYVNFANSSPGRLLVKQLDLPRPVRLRRHRPGDSDVEGRILVGGAPGGRLTDPVAKLLGALGAAVTLAPEPVAGEETGDRAESRTRAAAGRDESFAGLIYDATGVAGADGLRGLFDFFHPVVRAVRPCGRAVVLGSPPDSCESPREATAQRALEGFVRSLGKELGGGSTAQLVYVERGAEDTIESTLRFLLSAKSAYVSGQAIRIGPVASAAEPALVVDWARPLAGKVALVTGAARGIGEAIARILTRDGAHVVCLDVPAAGGPLAAVANDLQGSALQLDLTAPTAPARLVDWLRGRHGRLDILVHNAGITRDKTLTRMKPEQWDAVLDVNLISQERINDALLDASLIPPGGRIVSVSSTVGIAGNRGQTNYATSKAGVIGLVESMAPPLTARGITINAVAPGFIESHMTAAMPVLVREAGRRMNSVAQGGLPVDVAETIAWMASPGSGGVTGLVLRVCGQSLLGA